MKAKIALLAATAVLLVGALAAAPVQTKSIKTIMLNDRSEIRDAAAVNDAINAMVHDADTCSSRTERCICSFTASVRRLSNAYLNAVDKHPGWGRPDTGIEYQDPANGGTVAIVMSNVKRQLAMCERQ